MMRQILSAGGALALLATTPAVSAHEMKAAGEAPHVLELADVLDWETVSNPQISPDGVDVLYTRTRVDTLKDRRVSVGPANRSMPTRPNSCGPSHNIIALCL